MSNALIARNNDNNSHEDGEELMPLEREENLQSPELDNAFGIRMVSSSNAQDINSAQKVNGDNK